LILESANLRLKYIARRTGQSVPDAARNQGINRGKETG
jgi:hypothetical protein